MTEWQKEIVEERRLRRGLPHQGGFFDGRYQAERCTLNDDPEDARNLFPGTTGAEHLTGLDVNEMDFPDLLAL